MGDRKSSMPGNPSRAPLGFNKKKCHPSVMMDKVFCKSIGGRLTETLHVGKVKSYLKCLNAVRTKCWLSMMEVK